MPHLLVFNRSYYPDLGATGQLLAELCEDLVARHGWEVTVVAGPPTVALEGRASAGRKERVRGVTVLRAPGTRLPKARFAGRAANYLTYFGSAALAGGAVRRPDVVMALTDPPILGLAALAWARRRRAPFVFLCQDVFPEVARLLEDFQSAAVEAVLARVGRALVRRADRVVAVGETMRDRLVSLRGADPAKVAVIHNWGDRGALAGSTRASAFAREQGLDGRFVVMHAGNLGLGQGLETLVDAAGLLARNCPDLDVLFIGDGTKREALERRAREAGATNVRFLPFLPRERMAESYGAADLFVVSLKPGLAGFIVPSKLYAILAAGKPYVAAVEDACEVAAITRRHGSGLLAPPGDAAALAERIRALYRDRATLARLADRALQAGAAFDRPAAVAAYHALLSGLVTAAARPRGSRLTRGFDVGLAGMGLLASLPLWALVALLVKREDGGPVFFADERVGEGGRVFRVLKFRTMVPDADRRFGPRQASEGDPRVTRIGRLLRATAMDELPQLWSIFRGDMGFVGPRALRPGEIEARGDGSIRRLDTIAGYEARHSVRPGLTGLAQIYADRDVPVRHKFRYDRLYIGRRSLWLDLRLVALSFWITFRGGWERRGKKY